MPVTATVQSLLFEAQRCGMRLQHFSYEVAANARQALEPLRTYLAAHGVPSSSEGCA